MTEPLTERLRHAVDAARLAVDREVLVLELATGEHKHRPFLAALTRYGDLRAWEGRLYEHSDHGPSCYGALEAEIEQALKGADDGSA